MKIPVEDALRYIGAAHADEETRRLAEETAKMLEERLQPRYLWRAFRIKRGEDTRSRGRSRCCRR